MDVLIVLVFASVVLVIMAAILLFRSVKQGDYEHGDRLSLLPLEEDEGSTVPDVESRAADASPER